MLLGKRPRPPMRRTTSSMEFPAGVLFGVEAPQPLDQDGAGSHLLEPRRGATEVAQKATAGGADWRATRYVGSMLSPQGGVHGRNSGDFATPAATDTAPFLRACGLCHRRLGPGRDTYMYRGDIAFCSLECRQQRMNLDEQKEKCSSSVTSGPEKSDSGRKVAAT